MIADKCPACTRLQLLLSENSMDMTAINVVWGPLLLRPDGELRIQDLPPDPAQAQAAVHLAGESAHRTWWRTRHALVRA